MEVDVFPQRRERNSTKCLTFDAFLSLYYNHAIIDKLCFIKSLETKQVRVVTPLVNLASSFEA